MKIKKLERNEIAKFREIDRTEVVDQIYYFRNNKLELENEHYDVKLWTVEQQDQKTWYITKIFDRNGIGYGAYSDEKLVGMVILDSEFIGKDLDTLNMSGLWVSDGFRKKGIASRLIEVISEEARKRGAKAIYISSTPSKNTVEFYLNRGSSLTEHVDPRLFEMEPEDIHLVLPIT